MDYDSPFHLMEAEMARALSKELRVRVLQAGVAGRSAPSVARRFEVGISTAIRWLRRKHEAGERAARQQGKLRGSRLESEQLTRCHRAKRKKSSKLHMVVNTFGKLLTLQCHTNRDDRVEIAPLATALQEITDKNAVRGCAGETTLRRRKL